MTCAGIGAAVGLLRRDAVGHRKVWNLRSLAPVALWLRQLRRVVDAASDAEEEPGQT
jgi:hypothetical protein